MHRPEISPCVLPFRIKISSAPHSSRSLGSQHMHPAPEVLLSTFYLAEILFLFGKSSSSKHGICSTLSKSANLRCSTTVAVAVLRSPIIRACPSLFLISRTSSRSLSNTSLDTVPLCTAWPRLGGTYQCYAAMYVYERPWPFCHAQPTYPRYYPHHHQSSTKKHLLGPSVTYINVYKCNIAFGPDARDKIRLLHADITKPVRASCKTADSAIPHGTQHQVE